MKIPEKSAVGPNSRRRTGLPLRSATEKDCACPNSIGLSRPFPFKIQRQRLTKRCSFLSLATVTYALCGLL